jgi:hypothetical protein
MGVHNYVYEYVLTLPNFGVGPIEDKPIGPLLIQMTQRMAELTLAVGALAQGQQAFTHGAPLAGPALQPGTEAAGSADEIRKLSQRMEDLESRMAKV